MNSLSEDFLVKGNAGKCRRPRMKTTLTSLNAARRWKISGKGIAHVASSLGMKSADKKGTDKKGIVRVVKTAVMVNKVGRVETVAP